mgnify:CR=1 FL=1
MTDRRMPYEGISATRLVERNDDFDWPTFDENTAACLCYTSGTTGNPKGALYSHRSTMIHAYAAALPDTLNLSAREVVLPVVPMFHVNAWSLPYSCTHGRREDGVSRPAPRRQEPATSCSSRRA